MASWLVCSSPDRAVWVRALAVPPSTQEYKWVPANCWGNLTSCWGVTCDGLASRPGGVEILLAASCYGNQDKLWPDEPVLAPKASLTIVCLSLFHIFQALGSTGRAKTRTRVPRLSPPSVFLLLTFARPQLPRTWNRLIVFVYNVLLTLCFSLESQKGLIEA